MKIPDKKSWVRWVVLTVVALAALGLLWHTLHWLVHLVLTGLEVALVIGAIVGGIYFYLRVRKILRGGRNGSREEEHS